MKESKISLKNLKKKKKKKKKKKRHSAQKDS